MNLNNLSINVYSYNKGVEAFKNREYKKAVEFMTLAIKENPYYEFILAYKIRGFASANIKDFNVALSDFDKVINSLKGTNSETDNIDELYLNRGRIHRSLNNKKQAVEDFENCIKINNNSIEAHRHLCLAYNSIGDYENQLKSINKMIEFEPTPDWYVEKADTLFSLDRNKYLDEIISNYEKSIELSSTFILGYQGLAIVYQSIEEFTKAIDYYSKCILLTGFVGFYYSRGICYKKLGKIDRYISDVRKGSGLGDYNAQEEIENNIYLFNSKNLILFFDTNTVGEPKIWKAPTSDINNWPRLVQLAWFLYDDQGNLIETNSSVIKPDNFIIPREVSKVHGVTTEKAYAEGKDLNLVLEEFEDILKTASLLVAHNMSFDEKILGAEFIRVRNFNPLATAKKLCTMELSKEICRIEGPLGYKWPKLEELHLFLFRKGLDDLHNANFNANATASCYFEMKRRNLIN